MAPRKNVKKALVRRKAPARRRAPRRAMSQPDMAKMSVTRTLVKCTTNQIYSFSTFNLADYQRAVNVAGSFQRYRITGIKLTFKPEYDTFAALGAPTTATKPFLYYMIDKSGSIPDNITLEGLKQAGARPRAFDEKPITISWKPAVLNEVQGGGLIGPQTAVGAGYHLSPLLSTNKNPNNPGVWNPSTINHVGVKWYMETAGAPLDVYVEAELQFEFYKAIYPQLTSVPAKGLEYAVLDSSPDGVEGGTDGITIPLV